MTYLYYILGIILLVLLYASFEATWLQVSRIRFTKDKAALKILHLSDIHINLLRVKPSKIKKVIASEDPDIIIFSGDYIEKASQTKDFFLFLDFVMGSRTKDIYFCLGNHDYEAFENAPKAQDSFIKAMEARGCTVLHNNSVSIEKNSKIYNLIGIADMRYNNQDIEKALKSCIPGAHSNIAFSHNPDIVLEIPKGRVDYLFCGHFHGGQIWAPFNIEFSILRNEKLCKMRITRGLHRFNSINLYINRGIGNVVFPLRFLSRPEIAVFYLP